ncbi:hypothetical protein LINGRAHAP2_LOCUS3067 [Linum grandiflorum]
MIMKWRRCGIAGARCTIPTRLHHSATSSNDTPCPYLPPRRLCSLVPLPSPTGGVGVVSEGRRWVCLCCRDY